jgi:hypothetical protein
MIPTSRTGTFKDIRIAELMHRKQKVRHLRKFFNIYAYHMVEKRLSEGPTTSITTRDSVAPQSDIPLSEPDTFHNKSEPAILVLCRKEARRLLGIDCVLARLVCPNHRNKAAYSL